MGKPEVVYRRNIPGAVGASLKASAGLENKPLAPLLSDRLQALADKIDPLRPNRQTLHGLRIHLRNLASELRKLEEKVK